MNHLRDDEPQPQELPSKTQRLFVDEAGDPTLFHSSGKPIVDTGGCSRFFIIGKLEVDDPPALSQSLTDLRQEMLAGPVYGTYFTAQRPLTLEERFGASGRKKSSS